MGEVGRPKKELDYKLIQKLSEIHCTQEEIASVLGVNVRTLQRDEEFCRIYKTGIDTAKSTLRRYQWKIAETNPTMAIFLGKQYLGQRDNPNEESNADALRELVEAINGRTKND